MYKSKINQILSTSESQIFKFLKGEIGHPCSFPDRLLRRYWNRYCRVGFSRLATIAWRLSEHTVGKLGRPTMARRQRSVTTGNYRSLFVCDRQSITLLIDYHLLSGPKCILNRAWMIWIDHRSLLGATTEV